MFIYVTVAFLYNDLFRNSNFGNYHPVLAKRVSNVYDLTKLLEIKDKVKFFTNDIADLKTLIGCCGIKLFAGSSTGNLLVADEKDIEKVFQNSSKVVAVHSEDEAILNTNKKLIKNGDVHTHPVWRSVECALSSTKKLIIVYKNG